MFKLKVPIFFLHFIFMCKKITYTSRPVLSQALNGR